MDQFEVELDYVDSSKRGRPGRRPQMEPAGGFDTAEEKRRAESPKEQPDESTKRRRKQRRTGNLKEEIIEVSREVEDESTKLSQQEVDNDQWDNFWSMEGKRISRRDQGRLR